MFLHSTSKFIIYTWQVYNWWRGWTGSSWQCLTSTDTECTPFANHHKRIWEIHTSPSVRPSGIVVFRKCNSSRTAAQNFVNTLYLEHSLYCFVLCVHVLPGNYDFLIFCPFVFTICLLLKTKEYINTYAGSFDLVILCELSPLWNHFVY